MARWTSRARVALAGAVVLGSALALGGCASTPPAVAPVFDDTLFTAPATPRDARDLFALTPAMQQHLDERIRPVMLRKGGPMALADALQTMHNLQLDYDARFTRTAAEAFEARRGNCLSLVAMTAALAQALGLQVQFQEVLATPVVEANGTLTFVVGHINLMLRDALRDPGSTPGGRWLVIDFMPGQDLPRQRTRAIDEKRVRVMYLNNRAAEHLAEGRLDEAYAWLRAAAAEDPAFAATYNTLGVVYGRRGALALAEKALLQAQALAPANLNVRDNLAGVQLARALGLGGPRDALRAPAPTVVLAGDPAKLRRWKAKYGQGSGPGGDGTVPPPVPWAQ